MLLVLCGALAFATIDEPDSSRIEEDLLILTGEKEYESAAGPVTIESRNIFHPGNELARAYLRQRLEDIDGLSVTEQSFLVDGQLTYNLIGDISGMPHLPMLVLGAHYDSTGTRGEGYDPATDPAPGADDDASGVAGVLEVARLFAASESGHQYPLRFVLFSAEEEGLLGSKAYVNEYAAEPVRLMVQFDPIGYNPGDLDRVFVVYDEHWKDGPAFVDGVSDTFLDLVAMDRELIGGGERSDHAPFWSAGYSALHVATFPMPVQNHTGEDTLDLVDIEMLTEVVDVTAEHFDTLARPRPARVCGSSPVNSDGWWYGGGWLFLALIYSIGQRGPRLARPVMVSKVLPMVPAAKVLARPAGR
ncbi:MAG: Zn-dependent exopeptidase M28 [Proteobacteria bacterium]|nr:Zn-dependent exopeptidase M28 [Pseudomonadota bacterium]